jgi:hypothetical protein
MPGRSDAQLYELPHGEIELVASAVVRLGNGNREPLVREWARDGFVVLAGQVGEVPLEEACLAESA